MDCREMVYPNIKYRNKLIERLLFPKHEAVDGLWSTIAQSVACGPLKDAGVFLTKVAPTPSSAGDFVSRDFANQALTSRSPMSSAFTYMIYMTLNWSKRSVPYFERSLMAGLLYNVIRARYRAVSRQIGSVHSGRYWFESSYKIAIINLATYGSNWRWKRRYRSKSTSHSNRGGSLMGSEAERRISRQESKR